MKLAHKRVVVRRRRLLRNEPVDQMAQIRFAGQATTPHFFIQHLGFFPVEPELDMNISISHCSCSPYFWGLQGLAPVNGCLWYHKHDACGYIADGFPS